MEQKRTPPLSLVQEELLINQPESFHISQEHEFSKQRETLNSGNLDCVKSY